jgi:hypothetical protein
MQLHATLDLSLSAPSLPPSQKIGDISNVFYLGREIFRSVLETLLAEASDANDTKLRRFQDICNGEWDMFMQVFPDGSLAIRAVAASTWPVINRLNLISTLEYRSATSDSPQAIQYFSNNRPLSSSYTFMHSCRSWPYQTNSCTGFSSSLVCALARAFELLRLMF